MHSLVCYFKYSAGYKLIQIFHANNEAHNTQGHKVRKDFGIFKACNAIGHVKVRGHEEREARG